MIEEIRIRNLGVIADASLPLGPGFTAITGETGAGKTMVVTALGLLRGERAESATVRSGAEAAEVEGRWLLADDQAVGDIVDEAGGRVDDGELILVRSLSAEGRSRAFVGGRSTPVGVLSSLGDALVAVHGQSEQIRLRSAVAQREALDRFAGAGFADELGHYQHAFRQWRADATELTELTDARDARVREADDLRVAVAEIEALAPQPGEDVELASLAERLTNSESLRHATALAREAISSEADAPDVLGLVEAARRALDKVSAVDPVLAGVASEIADAGARLADAAHSLSSHLASLEGEGQRDLDLVQERRADLNAVMRKFGPSLDDVLAYVDRASQRLLELDSDSTRIDDLQHRVSEQERIVTTLALDLHAKRVAVAAELSTAVTVELAALAMPDAHLVVQVTAHEEPSLHGIDSVAFLLRPHPGAEPRPIAKGASGGELSRIMLALEVVVASADTVPTYVFDEVDAGVGGAAAIEIGRRLARLAQSAQVIVVTHLAQVAAFANNHLRVLKDTSGEVTLSSVVRLDGADREQEMARLLSGLSDSDSGLAHARELLELSATNR